MMRAWLDGESVPDTYKRLRSHVAALLPTPTASIATKGGDSSYGTGSPQLTRALGARKPTTRVGTAGTRAPTILSTTASGAAAPPSSTTTPRLLPTPTVKGNHNRAGLSAKSGDGLATAVGGTLHPHFVEWMMGLPRDWTRATMTRGDAEAKRAMMKSKRPTGGESERSETRSSRKSPR